jgi:hypothetical protein
MDGRENPPLHGERKGGGRSSTTKGQSQWPVASAPEDTNAISGQKVARYRDTTPLQNQHQSRYADAEDGEAPNVKLLDQTAPIGDALSPDRAKEHSPREINSPKSRDGIGTRDQENNDDDASVVKIELIYCQHCKKSYAPATYKKFCQNLDENGVPKCMAKNKKRRVYNSAKIRITSNAHLNTDEQRQVIVSRKKVVADMRDKAKGRKKPKKRNKLWKQQSDDFRKAMEANRLISKAEKEGRPSHYYL